MDNTMYIQQLLTDIEALPLSKTIPRILPYALECKDYKGYCVLSHLITPVANNPNTNVIQDNELARVLLIHGLSAEVVLKTLQESRGEHLELKTVAVDQISSHSIRELEEWLAQANETLASSTHVTAASYEKLASRIAEVRRLYETIRGYVVSKLTFYQQILKKANESISIPKKFPNKTETFNMEKVFIVHGHNGEIKEAVARLIEKQEIQAIILHEQANQGATIIEKFERHSDVGCAICLFTADDYGRAKNETAENLRARQNVVFETGYFIGKLGRDKIVLIADKGVDIPSDLQGVVYTDSFSWQFSVLKELKAIGYNIDYNKLV